jgi:hypothetical protein
MNTKIAGATKDSSAVTFTIQSQGERGGLSGRDIGGELAMADRPSGRTSG